MKSLIAAIILLTVIIAGTITNSFFLTSTLNEIYSSLENQSKLYGNEEDSINTTLNILEKSKSYLYFTLPSTSLDELYSEYAESCEYFYQGESAAYKATLEKVKKKISQLIMHEKFTLYNIF